MRKKSTIENETKPLTKLESLINDTPHHIVGLGASAGGLEALEFFFTNMPSDSGMAFVVVQHLSPDYKSLMVELLSKRTEMNVFRAEEGMKVQPNCVYLIQPKKNITIFHGKLLLSDPQQSHRGINLPIDIFLRSLAEDQGEKAIAIILSGTGSDGMRGVRAIKENGGIIIVQDDASAKFDGMPRSAISTGLADFILPPNEMPAQLVSYINHPYVTKKQAENHLSTEDDLTRIFSFLREKSKVDFTYYKMSTVIRRIERRMSVNQIENISEYVNFLENMPREYSNLFRELLIGVTNFFRDPQAFKELEEKWVPEILKYSNGNEIRFWVAGCSTGEEAYSLAIIAQECMEKINRNIDIKIFATDIDMDAILYAGNGLYPESIAADLSPHLLSKYFFKNGENFQIARNIREMVVFAKHNIIKDPPFTNIELISCRNLLIYFQPILQQKVLDLFNFSLNLNGILFLGSSESIGDMTDYFKNLHPKWKIYQSTGKTKARTGLPEKYDKSATSYKIQKSHFSGTVKYLKSQENEQILERFLNLMENDLLPLSIIVNEQLELIHVLGDSTGYFKLPSGKVYNDITKMAFKELSIPLATGLQKVFKKRSDVSYSNIRIHNNDQVKTLTMNIKMLPEKKGQEPLAAIFLHEQEVNKNTEKLPTLSYDVGADTEQRIIDLEQDLQFTKENLQATIEELETSNEELQATNEELLASNEELQSTNEELQSVNEELHTVNAEYQSKIIELTELNNDLDNLFSSTEIGTIFLDENLEIRKFTPSSSEMFNIKENDVGRPISDLSHKLKQDNIIDQILNVVNTQQPFETQVQNIDDNWYFMRIIPYNIGPSISSGLVITFIDITALKKLEKDKIRDGRWLETSTQLAKIGYWEYFPETGEHNWSDEIFHIHDLKVKEQPTPDEGIDFYTQEFRPQIIEAFTNASEKGIPYDLLLEIVSAKGTKKWVRTIGKVDKNGKKVKRIYGALQDVTDFQKLQMKLEKTQNQYKELFKNIKSGVAIYEVVDDGKTFILKDMNKAGEKITGVKSEQVINNSLVKIFPGAVNMGLVDALKKVWESGKPFHLPAVEYKDKTKSFWVENDIYKLESGEVVAVYTEITEKVKIQNDLYESNERIKNAYERSGYAWWEWNVKSNKVLTSPFKPIMIGLAPEKVEETLDFWTSHIHPDDFENTMQVMRDYLAGKKSQYVAEYRLRTVSGDYKYFRDIGEIIERDQDGSPLRVMGVVQEIRNS